MQKRYIKKDINGFRPEKARQLEESIKDAEKNSKTFTSAKQLINNLSYSDSRYKQKNFKKVQN